MPRGLLYVALGACLVGLAHAEAFASAPAEIPPLTSEHDGRIIASIDYDIEGTVEPSAIARALHQGVGDPFVAADWQADVQTILNLGFFRRIDTEIVRADASSVALKLHVRTNWSLLPYLAYEGGAVPMFIIGGYYANTLGQMVEAGGYYMRRGPYNLGRAWLMLPHVLAPRSLLDVEVIFTGDTVAFYPGDATQLSDAQRRYYGRSYRYRVPARGIELMRRGAYLDFGMQPITDWLTVSLRYGVFSETQVDLENLPEVIDAETRGTADIALQRGKKRNAVLSLVSATAIAGQVNLVDNFLFRGHELRTVLVGSRQALGSARDFTWLYLSYRGFADVLPRLNVGARVIFAHSTSTDPVDDWNLGGSNLEPFIYAQRAPGLFSVRGLRQHQFRGRELTVVNLEPRLTLLRDQPLGPAGDISLQAAGFVDAGRAWTGEARPKDLRGSSALIAGGGLLLTLLDFRFTYLHWYVARVIAPYSANSFGLVFTRQYF